MKNEIYSTNEWDAYAQCHASVLSSFQLELFLEAVKYLSGDIIDCGCGTARLAPFLADQPHVISYTGVDASEEMSSVARHLIGKLSNQRFSIINSRIEKVEQKFSSAVSIHSYYSWPAPRKVLQHIFNILKPCSFFVLATPNKQLDMPFLLREAEKELLCHPDYENFKHLNLQLVHNPEARFISLDELVSQVQEVGFEVTQGNQNFYHGGVNFLLLKKP